MTNSIPVDRSGSSDRDAASDQVVKQAPCGCKWYEDGTVYRCLDHADLNEGLAMNFFDSLGTLHG